MTQYQTIAAAAQAEYVVKRSRFIGQLAPVQSCEQVTQLLQKLKRQHREARHQVYACLLREGQIQRYSDDGEPQGTAGIPALELLRRANLTDCAIVVTRYFGGVLLGAPGLTRAYTHCTKLAVEAAEIVTMTKCRLLRVRCDYALYGKLAALIPEQGGIIEDTQFDDGVTLRVCVPLFLVPRLEKTVQEVSFGKSQPDIIAEKWSEIPR